MSTLFVIIQSLSWSETSQNFELPAVTCLVVLHSSESRNEDGHSFHSQSDYMRMYEDMGLCTGVDDDFGHDNFS